MARSLQELRAEEIIKCPDCGSADIIKEDNEIYCNRCGTVIE